MPRSPRFEMFEMRCLRIDQKPRGNREGRSLGRVRQTRHAERTPDAHRPTENAPGEFRQPGELAGAAGQNDLRARLGLKRRGRKSVATRGLMMRTRRARETNCGGSRSSSLTGGTAIMSRSSDPPDNTLP
jgi:hypothetical protein